MKIDDGTLNRYLIKNLQSLTEADPSLLANYVAALLRNNKPKKELQKLCIDQLYDFLGDGTKSFVAKLFHALEDGTVPSSTEEMEPSKPMESGSVVTSTDVVELRTSSPQVERLLSTAVRAFSDEGEDESSDDEDDDRNHKHRRRVTRSRSFDRDGEEEDRGVYRKRGRSTDNGQGLRDNDRLANDRRGPGHTMHSERDSNNKFDRRMGREHGSGRFNSDGGQRGNLRTGPQFRGEGPGPRYDGPNGMMRGGMGRGRGLGGSWPPIDQRFPPPPFSDGSEFAPPLLPPGPPTSGFFAGRGMPGRGVPHTPWPGYGPHPGMGNGPLEHAHPLSGGMQGGRGPPPMSGGIGLSMSMGRPRCLDFEERGYCLRGDLCPMEHGANRIVVEDVQSLSKFNLPVSIPSGRGMGIGAVSGPSAGPMLPPGLAVVNRGNRGSRETSSPAIGEDPALLNGAAPTSAGAEPDLYDPDQPLWNKERPNASTGLRKLPSYQKGTQDPDWDGDLLEKRESREGSETVDVGRVGRGGSTNGAQGTESGPSVWDRIGPVDRVGTRLDGGLRPVGSPLEGLHSGKLLRKDGAEDMPARARGVWPVKWNRDVDADEENGPRGAIANSTPSRGRGGGRSETGSGQRSGEGTSYGSRVSGSRGNSGFGSERAQRTLYVSFIPVLSNRTELLTAHFQKFGHVLDIRIPAHSDRAFVQFSRREDAESALTAPDAVMGNRFIRLSWANRDSIPDPGDNVQSITVKVPGKSGPVTTTQAVTPLEKATLNGSANIPVEVVALSEGVGKAIAANGSSSLPAISGATLKKQEELEKMREAIRKKQESLAQKRVDFRRKLEAKLAKQGPGQGDGSDSEQSAKRQKLDDAVENSSGPLKQGVSTTTMSQSSPSQAGPQTSVEPSSSGGLSKTNSGEVSKQSTVTGGVSQPAQPSPRSGRLQNTRGNITNLTYQQVAWGPARFKLDNRTTILRVLPPFPSAVTDVAVLKEHFGMFGELSTVEVEDAEGQKVEGITKLSEINSVRVSFATRRAAERAYATGRWLQGQSLQLVWVTSTNNSAGSGGTAGSSALVTSGVLSGGPYMEQERANGNRYSDRETTESGQENQDTANDGDVSGEEAGYQVSREERKCSASVPNQEWRRENALQVRAATKVVGRTTESGAETRH